MVKLQEYNHGQEVRKHKISDKDFTGMLLNGSLEFSHTNESGNWYRDCGNSVYLTIK